MIRQWSAARAMFRSALPEKVESSKLVDFCNRKKPALPPPENRVRRANTSHSLPQIKEHGLMKTSVNMILSVAILSISCIALVGCGGDSAPEDSANRFALNSQDGDEEEKVLDHTHIVKLSNDAQTQVDFAEDIDFFSVQTKSLGDVSKVQVTTSIDGVETVYEFERSDTPDGLVVYGLQNADLASAFKGGSETVLKIITADGELTGTYKME